MWPISWLEVRDVDASRTLLLSVVSEGEVVTLRYRHSLYGGFVWEILAIRGGRFVLEELEAEREAALEYYQVNGRITAVNGRYRISGLHQPFEALQVRATLLGGRTLIFRGKEIPLAGSEGDGHLVWIRIARGPLVQFLLSRLR